MIAKSPTLLDDTAHAFPPCIYVRRLVLRGGDLQRLIPIHFPSCFSCFQKPQVPSGVGIPDKPA